MKESQLLQLQLDVLVTVSKYERSDRFSMAINKHRGLQVFSISDGTSTPVMFAVPTERFNENVLSSADGSHFGVGGGMMFLHREPDALLEHLELFLKPKCPNQKPVL